MPSADSSRDTVEYLNNIFLLPDGLSSRQTVGGIMQFLVEHVSVFGVDLQNWMLIVLGMTAVYALFSWKTGDRT
jgi:hypothetical protein